MRGQWHEYKVPEILAFICTPLEQASAALLDTECTRIHLFQPFRTS